MKTLRANNLIALLLAITIPGGCGTQIGNPGDEEDETFLMAVSNSLFLEAVAGLGTGEYLVNADQKTITETDCSEPNRIKRTTSTEHSQKNDLADRATEVALTIERSATDTLQDIDFSCSEDGSVAIAKFGDNSQIESIVTDERIRVIDTTIKESAKTISQTSEVSTTGTRVLSITNTEEETLSATIKFDTKKTIKGANLNPILLEVEQSTLAFTASRGAGGVTYTLDQQEIRGTTNAGTVTMRFENVIFSPELKCYPESGKISIDFADRGTFTLNVTDGYNAGFVGERQNLFFGPDGCDFYEQ